MSKQKQVDMVNNPPHYQGAGGLQPIDVVEAFDLGFNTGNAVKYLCRAGRKGSRLEDLRKAAWYVAREIRNEEKTALEPVKITPK